MNFQFHVVLLVLLKANPNFHSYCCPHRTVSTKHCPALVGTYRNRSDFGGTCCSSKEDRVNSAECIGNNLLAQILFQANLTGVIPLGNHGFYFASSLCSTESVGKFKRILRNLVSRLAKIQMLNLA